MKVPFFLTVKSNGGVRVTKNRPNLDWDEITIAMSLELPPALFQRPALSASIVVPDDAARPMDIEPAVLDNIKKAIQTSTGLEVKINFEEQPS